VDDDLELGLRAEEAVIVRAAVVVLAMIPASTPSLAQERPRNIWEQQYRDRSAADLAAQFEDSSRPVFRHRAEIVRLLDLRPGMVVAEVGAGSGFLSRMIAERVAPGGRVIATELDDKMVTYMNERARAEGLSNFSAIRGLTASTGLARGSTDAILIVNTYSFFDRPDEMLRSVSDALERGGLLVMVDFPRASHAAAAEGADPDQVVAVAAAAGLDEVDRSSAIPGHYAIRFRKR
jgi:precorrin-6B methylase 2